MLPVMGTDDQIAQLSSTRNQVAGLVQEAKALRITDDFSRGRAVDLRSAITRGLKQVEDARTQLVKPLNDHVANINARFRPLKDSLDAARADVDREILRDRKEQERLAEERRRWQEAEVAAARKAAEEDQAARAREIAAQAEVVAKEAGMSPAEAKEMGQLYAQDELAKPLQEKPVTVVEIPDPPKTIAGQRGTSTIRNVWDFRVLDIARLARLIPEAIEVKRKPVLDRIREYEEKGLLHFESDGTTVSVFGVVAFKREEVSGR